MSQPRGHTTIRVSYQGIPGAFGEEAVERHWGGAAEAVGAPSFQAAIAKLTEAEVDRAAIPVWNSTIGAIVPAVAEIDRHAHSIMKEAEIEVPVKHCLLARPGVARSAVRFVGSHPAALGQCRGYFERHPELVACEAFDTAGAARELASGSEPGSSESRWFEVAGAPLAECAVLASAGAARRYGLVILEEAVQDDPLNLTRFAVLRRVT